MRVYRPLVTPLHAGIVMGVRVGVANGIVGVGDQGFKDSVEVVLWVCT